MLSPVKKTFARAGLIATRHLLLYLFSAGCAMAADAGQSFVLKDSLVAEILHESAANGHPGDRIISISSYFLDTPYLANSLIGGPAQTEQLVLRLDGFDCFTFLDTVEALRRSNTAADFPEQIMQVRYRNGVVTYESRKHFFSDWVAELGSPVKDVTAKISQGREVYAHKKLNARADGTNWVAGIGQVPRTIAYIPTNELDETLLDALEPGDYVGVFSQRPGLDVSHTGLIVKDGSTVMLRHASSREGVQRVIDEELVSYLQGKTGLVVYRVTQ